MGNRESHDDRKREYGNTAAAAATTTTTTLNTGKTTVPVMVNTLGNSRNSNGIVGQVGSGGYNNHGNVARPPPPPILSAGGGGGGGDRGSLDVSRLSDSGRKLLVQALCADEPKNDIFGSNNSLYGNSNENGMKTTRERLDLLSKRKENEICADCFNEASTWVSVTFGVFLCAQCVGAHRSLGVDISFAQSTTIDDSSWSEESLSKLENTNNLLVNNNLEYFVPPSWPKPDDEAPGSYRREYIRAKYERKLFSKQLNKDKSFGCAPIAWSNRKTMLDRTKSITHQAKIEFIGIVSITILRGKNLTPTSGTLPVPPTLNMNPYCVVKLGNLSTKTKITSRTLNPEWNEGPSQNVGLNMSWDGLQELKISVWNSDRLSTKDKIIGSAVVDIRELGTVSLQGMKPRIWVKLFEFKPEKQLGWGTGSNHGSWKNRKRTTKANSTGGGGEDHINNHHKTGEKDGDESSLSDSNNTYLDDDLSEHDETEHFITSDKKKYRSHSRNRSFNNKSFTKFHIREKMKDAITNLKTAMKIQKSFNNEDSDEDEETDIARREKGYFYAGKIEIELSLIDLR